MLVVLPAVAVPRRVVESKVVGEWRVKRKQAGEVLRKNEERLRR